jgi:hypothetical protein
LGLEAAGRQGELAVVSHFGPLRSRAPGALLIETAWQAGEALLMEDLPDGGRTERGILLFQRGLNIIDRQILLAHGEDQIARSSLFGLRARAALELAEEVGLVSAEVVAQDAEGTGGVAETPGDLFSGELFDKISAQGLVLTLAGGGWVEEEAGFLC